MSIQLFCYSVLVHVKPKDKYVSYLLLLLQTSAHLEMIIEDFDKIQVANVELLLVLFHENFATAKDLIKTIKQKISKSSTHTRIVEVEGKSFHLFGSYSSRID